MIKKILIELQNLKKYLKFYIVVSTWKDEIKYKDEINKFCEHIIFNEKPKKMVLQNKLQLKSTYTALLHLKKKLNIRLNQEQIAIYNPNSLNFLYNLIKIFQ